MGGSMSVTIGERRHTLTWTTLLSSGSRNRSPHQLTNPDVRLAARSVLSLPRRRSALARDSIPRCYALGIVGPGIRADYPVGNGRKSLPARPVDVTERLVWPRESIGATFTASKG